MQTEPDVLTEHNEIILSTSIERIVTGRDFIQPQTEKLLKQFDVVFQPTSENGEGTRLVPKIRAACLIGNAESSA